MKVETGLQYVLLLVGVGTRTLIIAISLVDHAAAGWPVLTHSHDRALHVTLICSFFSDAATGGAQLCRVMSLFHRTPGNGFAQCIAEP